MSEQEMDRLDKIRWFYRAMINALALDRPALEEYWGQVWNTEELERDYTVKGFGAPLCVVTRKSDGKVGSLFFQHHPRFYFGWEEDKREQRKEIAA